MCSGLAFRQDAQEHCVMVPNQENGGIQREIKVLLFSLNYSVTILRSAEY